MKNKMLMTVAMVMLAGVSAQAVLQYVIVSSPSPGEWQSYTSAQQLTIKINEGGSLWMSGYVSDWGGTLTDLGTTADMTAGNYGWMTADGTIVSGTGETMDVTFTNGVASNSTTAYHVGDFVAGDEIGLWLTNTNKNNPDQEGYSLGPVQQGLNEELDSRQINTVDLAGNTRINFGFAKGGGSVEFVLVGGEGSGGTVGQPLPGVFATLLLAGSVGTALTRRNRKRK